MSCFRCFRQRKRRVKLMFVGLDGAGKSTLLQTIVGDPEDFEPTVPTVGFHNVRTGDGPGGSNTQVLIVNASVPLG